MQLTYVTQNIQSTKSHQLLILVSFEVPNVYDATLVANHDLRLIGVQHHSIYRGRHLKYLLAPDVRRHPENKMQFLNFNCLSVSGTKSELNHESNSCIEWMLGIYFKIYLGSHIFAVQSSPPVYIHWPFFCNIKIIKKKLGI